MKKYKFTLNTFSPFAIIMFALLTVYSIMLILPISWGIMTSVKSLEAFLRSSTALPKDSISMWEWNNFKVVFDKFFVRAVTPEGKIRSIGMAEQIYNTFLYAGIGSIISAFVPCVMAYVVAKFDYKFSKIIYSIVVITMILPIVGSLPSELSLLRSLGLYDRMWGNWIQKANFLGLYFLVFYSQFKSMPNDFSEAAYVSGASEFTIMTRIMLPLVSNTLFTVILIKFIENWNDYQTVLLFLPSNPTLAYGLYALSRNTERALDTVPIRMASSVMLVLPILILFIMFRNKLLNNLSMGGVKE